MLKTVHKSEYIAHRDRKISHSVTGKYRTP
jgi:hypothetical protein